MALNSPLSRKFRRVRNRTPFRARGRSAGQWTPAYLQPYAWYDVHAGGTASTIVDTSGNGRADATYGAGANAPLYLPYTGTAYVHLEAATAGTNSISCTAPAGTASYSAAPLGGGAPTTGAAAPGAFTFTTAGDWLSIQLLDAGAAEVARFDASASAQTGHTDAYAVVWAVNRGTAGGKTVVLGPAANSTRSVALLRTNDYITVPAAAMPDLDVGLSGTVVAVWREWATLSAIARLWDTRAIDNTTVGTRGVAARKSGGGTTGVLMSDDTATLVSRNISGISAGVRYVSTSVWDATNVNQYTNNTAAGTTARPAGSLVSGNDVLVGAATTTTRFMDGEFTGWLSFGSALTASQVAQIVAYYGGGL